MERIWMDGSWKIDKYPVELWNPQCGSFNVFYQSQLFHLRVNMRGLILLLPALLVLFLAPGKFSSFTALYFHHLLVLELYCVQKICGHCKDQFGKFGKGKPSAIRKKLYHFFLILSGSARTEEESSLAGDADLPSNILPLSEKVNILPSRNFGVSKYLSKAK